MVCECSFDDVNGEYATYALAWGEACVHDVSVDAAFVQRVADALNGQDVPPSMCTTCWTTFTVWAKPPGHRLLVGMNGRQQPPRPRFGGFAQVSLPKKAGEKAKLQEHFTKI